MDQFRVNFESGEISVITTKSTHCKLSDFADFEAILLILSVDINARLYYDKTYMWQTGL